ncbi:MAG: ribosome maturation factor RimP [Longimicrobiales bacterium]
MSDETLQREVEGRVEQLGFEFVALERAGSRSRPILRLRIDRPDATAGHGVTVDDCSRVSRALETYLDEEAGLGERYVLEVSSPGVERPLVRRRDFDRFAGEEVAIRTETPVADLGRRLEGELVGVVDAGGVEHVRLRLKDSREIDIPRAQIARAHLVFRWRDHG